MKIAHFTKILSAGPKTSSLRVGGSESSVMNLAEAQAKKHKIIILNSSKTNKLKIKNINFFHLKYNFINIFFNNPFFKLIKSFGKPDIVIIHEIYNFNIIPLICFSKFLNLRVYICPRGTLSPIALQINKFRKYFYHQIFFRNIVKLTNGFIALNEGERAHIKKLFRNYRVYLIPNGVNQSYFNFKILKKSIGLKLKRKKILIGFLGRYDFFIKGLDILVNEYQIYLKKSFKKSIKLIFVGEHRVKHGFSSKLIINNFNKKNKKNSIIVSGPFYDKKKYNELQKFDILIQPSRSEGMPNAVLEALSMAVPVAATKETNILSILKKSNSGWEINHTIYNISNFFLKIEKINKKIISCYGLRGYKYSKSKFNIQKISDYCFHKNRIRSYKF